MSRAYGGGRDAPDAPRELSMTTRNSHREVLARASERAMAFRDGAATRPPRPEVTPATLRASLGGPTPERGAPWTEVIDALADAAEPGIMGVTGPRFFGWVIGASHPAGVAADWLTSAWGQNVGLYAGSPSAAIAEEVAARWLLDLLGLPAGCAVGFVTGATLANFACLAAARDEMLRRSGWDVAEGGLRGAPDLRICIGEDAHATVFKSLEYLGFGRANLTRVASDREGRMRASALETALARADVPTIVIAQAGQINTGAFDPFNELPALCRAADAWLHVDGAFGLWARAAPDRAHLAVGVDQADSWSTDAHKWLQVPYDSGLAIVRDRAALGRAMTIGASYLPDDDALPQPSHYVPELSRRARGFAVWAVLKALGREGVAELVTRHCACARRAAERLAAEPGIEILNEVALNQLAVGFGAGWDLDRQSAAAKEVVAHVQAANRVFIGGADWRGRWIARVSVISNDTAFEDVDVLADEIIAAWRSVRAGNPLSSGSTTGLPASPARV
jgi:glutamate/tyrosine decarboxylase-like PLP-dependent enzyme